MGGSHGSWEGPATVKVNREETIPQPSRPPAVPDPSGKLQKQLGLCLCCPSGIGKLDVSFLQSLEHPESLKAGHGDWPQQGPMSAPGSVSRAL